MFVIQVNIAENGKSAEWIETDEIGVAVGSSDALEFPTREAAQIWLDKFLTDQMDDGYAMCESDWRIKEI